MNTEGAEARRAARYLESLGIEGALKRTMDVATFAAGRSRAIELLVTWERETAYQLLTDDDIEDVVKEVGWIAIEAMAHPPEPYTENCRAKIEAIRRIVRMQGWPK